MLRALLWDVDGTIAETERDGHRVAFNRAFEDLDLPWRWDVPRYGALLRITGGRERLLHDMADRSDAPRAPGEREALARALHARKNACYAELVRGARLPLRAGVAALMDDCARQGVPMAIATTTSRANVEALLGLHLGARWQQRFAAVVCGEDVRRKKPDPEVYLRALRALDVHAHAAVAIEDSPAGVAAACAAGLSVVVTRSAYFGDAAFPGALAIGPGLHTRGGWSPALRASAGGGDGCRVRLADLQAWCARGVTESPSG